MRHIWVLLVLLGGCPTQQAQSDKQPSACRKWVVSSGHTLSAQEFDWCATEGGAIKCGHGNGEGHAHAYFLGDVMASRQRCAE